MHGCSRNAGNTPPASIPSMPRFEAQMFFDDVRVVSDLETETFMSLLLG